MILIVGLGNPGNEYKNTRHNVGYLVIDKLSQISDVPPKARLERGGKCPALPAGRQNQSSNLKIYKKFKAEIGNLTKGIILLKPLTFMNLSGEAVIKAINYYKIDHNSLIVIHDDADLPLGQIKIQRDGGSAGHHGVESIIKVLKTNDFIRFRVGIGRPESLNNKHLTFNNENKEITDFVLEKFSKEEGKIVKKVIEKTAKAIKYFLEFGLIKAMNKYN